MHPPLPRPRSLGNSRIALWQPSLLPLQYLVVYPDDPAPNPPAKRKTVLAFEAADILAALRAEAEFLDFSPGYEPHGYIPSMRGNVATARARVSRMTMRV